MIKSLKNICLLMIALASFQSCLKTDARTTIVTGEVTNKITGEPVKGIPIEIIEAQGWTGKYLTTTQTVYTNDDGRYKTSISVEKGKSYKD